MATLSGRESRKELVITNDNKTNNINDIYHLLIHLKSQILDRFLIMNALIIFSQEGSKKKKKKH